MKENEDLTNRILDVINISNMEKILALESLANVAAICCALSKHPDHAAEYFLSVFSEFREKIVETDLN